MTDMTKKIKGNGVYHWETCKNITDAGEFIAYVTTDCPITERTLSGRPVVAKFRCETCKYWEDKNERTKTIRPCS